MYINYMPIPFVTGELSGEQQNSLTADEISRFAKLIHDRDFAPDWEPQDVSPLFDPWIACELINEFQEKANRRDRFAYRIGDRRSASYQSGILSMYRDVTMVSHSDAFLIWNAVCDLSGKRPPVPHMLRYDPVPAAPACTLSGRLTEEQWAQMLPAFCWVEIKAKYWSPWPKREAIEWAEQVCGGWWYFDGKSRFVFEEEADRMMFLFWLRDQN